MQLDIKYGSTTLASLTDVGTKTYATSGKFADKNLIVDVVNAGVDTSDATATAGDILNNYTGYVQGNKVTGNIQDYDGTSIAEHDFLCFTANTAGSTILFPQQFEYSTDKQNWVTATEVITLANVGDKIYVRKGSVEIPAEEYVGFGTFTMTGSIAASGSIMSLVDNTAQSVTFTHIGLFGQLFAGCTALTSAPELPATTIAMYGYVGMFKDCTNLTEAPVLPATYSQYGCYQQMFENCTSLTSSCPIKAQSGGRGYDRYKMFAGCTSIRTVSKLDTTTFWEYSCSEMYAGCPLIVVKTTAQGNYTHPWRLPMTCDAATHGNWSLDMFKNTGSDVVTPEINTTYYLDHDPV